MVLTLGKGNPIEAAIWSKCYRDMNFQWDSMLADNASIDSHVDVIHRWLSVNAAGYRDCSVSDTFYIRWIEFESEEHLNWFLLSI